jgi:hypothetical protein
MPLTAVARSILSDAYQTGKLQALIAATVFSIGLGTGVVVFFDSFRDSGTQSAYAASSVCAAPSMALASQGCRYEGQAKLLSATRNDRLEATVSFDSLRGRTFSTSFPRGNEPGASVLIVGSNVPATLWDGQITELAGKSTVDSPLSLAPQTERVLGSFFGVLSLIGLLFTARLVRDAWRKP